MATNKIRQNQAKKDRTKSSGQSLSSQVSNYKTRLRASGIDPDAVTDDRNFLEKALNLEKNQGLLFDVLEVINRPQNALLTGIDKAKSGESFAQGLKEGFLGREKTSGKDLLVKHAGMSDTKGKLDWSDVLGFGVDLATDPLDWALIPLTGGASKAAEVGVDTAQAASKAAKALNAVDTVADASKAVKAVEKGTDAAKTAGKAFKYSKLDDLLGLSEKGIHLASGNELIGRGIAKTIKGTGKAANKIIEGSLGTLDKVELNKLEKAAKKAGLSVEDFAKMKRLDVSDFGNRLEDFRNVKKAIKGTFNEASTKLGRLKRIARESEGQSDLVKEISNSYIKELKDTAYDFARNSIEETSENKTLLKNLDDFIAQGGTYADWLEANKGEKVAELLTQRADKAADDILNMLESGRDTTVKGRKAINDLLEGGFKGNKKSVEDLTNLINKYADQSKLPVGLKDTLKELQSAGIEDLSNKNIALNLLDGKTNNANLKKLLQDEGFLKELDNLELKYNFEYTPEELQYLDELGKNKDFMDLVNKNKGAYDKFTKDIKDITGFDYSDITGREGYYRRAQGTIADFDARKAAVEEALKNENLDAQTKEALQAQLQNIEKQKSEYKSTAKKAFRSREYVQPAMVTNRQAKEAAEAQIKQYDKQIENLTQNLSDTKSFNIENKLEGLKDNIKVGKYEGSLEKGTQRLNKLQEQNNQIKSTLNTIKDRMDESFINKAVNIQDKSVTKSFEKALTNVNEIQKQIAKETDPAKLEALTNKLSEQTKKLAVAQAKIDGAVDNETLSLLNKHAKDLEAYQKSVNRLAKNEAQIAEQTAKNELVRTKLGDIVKSTDDSIKKLEYELKHIDKAGDQKILDQIKSLERSKAILQEQAGQTVFSNNYFAGLEDFINNAELTNKTANIYKDAIETQAFLDPEIMSLTPAKGKTKVDGSLLANKLNDVQTIIGGGKINEGTTELINALKDKTFYMDDRAKALFEVLEKNTKNKEAKGLLNLIDRFNTTFKKFSTLTPGFHLRNMAGNATNMYLSGMSPTNIAKYQTKATLLMNDSNKLLKKVASEGVDKLTKEEAESWKILKQFYQGGFGQAGTAVMDLEKVKNSIKLGSKSPVNIAANASVKFNNKVDNMNRLAMLMYANDNANFVRKLGANSPVQAVKYALMDPSNLSDAERNVVKRIIPFYTFTKQNLMFQATNMTKNLGRYNKVYKALRDAYNDLDENSYKQYQKDAMQIPIPWLNDENGNQLFLKANLPLSDLGEILSHPIQRTTASLSPIIKTPIEMATGKNLFTGNEANYTTLSGSRTSEKLNSVLNNMGIDTKGITKAEDAADLILNNFGLQNVSTNLVKKVEAILDNADGSTSGQQMWAEIFRSIVQSTNQEKIKNSGLYDDYLKYQAEVKRLKNQGIDVPTIKELTASNRIKLSNIKKKRATSR